MAITTSQTEITAIDATYPVAGQDNDSQGFRDNFSNIKNTLTKIKTDLDSLDTNSAVKNDEENPQDFNGNQISEADFIATTVTKHPIGTISASQNINFTNGHYQTVTLNGDVTLTFTGWPATGKVGKVRMICNSSDSTTHTITWQTQGGNIRYASDFPSPFQTTSDTNYKIVDFFTDDSGSNVFAHYIGSFT